MRPVLAGCLPLALLAGCPNPPQYGTKVPAEPTPNPPALTTFSLNCDVDGGSWTITATTDTRSGGGVTVWSTDLDYIERHNVVVIATDPDAGDELRTVLRITSDWRDQTPNSSTNFTCGDAPTVAFMLLDTDGLVSTCRIEGPLATALAAAPGVDCPEATVK